MKFKFIYRIQCVITEQQSTNDIGSPIFDLENFLLRPAIIRVDGGEFTIDGLVSKAIKNFCQIDTGRVITEVIHVHGFVHTIPDMDVF
jgi:hypothetical protein